MKLTINSNELEQAVASYVETLGFSLEGKDVSYTLDDNANCHIEIGSSNPVTTQTEKPVQKRKPRTTKTEEPTATTKEEKNITSDGVEELVWAEATSEEPEEQDTNIPFEETKEDKPVSNEMSLFG